MNQTQVVVIAIIVVVLIAAMIWWWIATSNNYARADVKASEALAGVEVALTKRFDMLTKLRDAALTYGAHERQVLAQLVELRQGMSVSQLKQASQQADSLAAQLRLVAENYPQLRSSDTYVELQEGVVNAEEHLQAARRLYNSNVTTYNTMLRVFPSNIVGRAQGLAAKQFFSQDDPVKTADVSLGPTS